MSETIKIDLSEINNAIELHKALKIQLELPSFYGMNWDAFWDSITGLVELPDTLVIYGWKNLQSKLPNEAMQFEKLLRAYNELYPSLECKIIYS